jgi:signal transduction histidine kinase
MTHRSDLKDESQVALLERVTHAEHELDALRSQLEHSHRLAMLGTISAGVLHEINNILTPILAYAQMASSNPSDTKLLIKVADKAARGIGQAAAIADSMLELAQPSRTNSQPAVANVREACQAALTCLGRDPAKDGITLMLDIPNDFTCAIRPLALQQVLLNLVLNAVEALKDHQTKDRILTIRAREQGGETENGCAAAIFRDNTPSDIIRIEVADTGPGIPEAIRPKLFTPFVSGRHLSRRPGSPSPGDSGIVGSGLGLSVCRTLIEAAGGTITAESSQDAGTIFTLNLPSVRAQCTKLAG